MTFPKFYVESDGDHVPKDVYICAGDGLGRVATVEGLSESTKFKVAHRIATACNTVDEVAAERDERRTVMADVVRALGHGCAGLSHAELAMEVKSIVTQRDMLLSALKEFCSNYEHKGIGAADLDRVYRVGAAAIALCEGGAK